MPTTHSRNIVSNYINESLMRGATVYEDIEAEVFEVEFIEDGEQVVTQRYCGGPNGKRTAIQDAVTWAIDGELPEHITL